MYTLLQITCGLSGLLHQKEGWESLHGPRLLEAQHYDSEECLPSATNPQHPQYGIQSQGKVLHQARHLVGI